MNLTTTQSLTLLITIQKVLTKIILEKLQPKIKKKREQEGQGSIRFRQSGSTIEAIFIIHQIG